MLLANVLDSLEAGIEGPIVAATRRTFNLILHIGTEKTGTSTLQTALLGNAPALSAHGVHYLAWPGRSEACPLCVAVLPRGCRG